MIDLSGLETIHSPQQYYDSLTIDANGIGSQVLLGSLTEVTGGTGKYSGRTVFSANAGGSMDLPALNQIQNARFSASNGGVITGTVAGATYDTRGLWYDSSSNPYPHTYNLVTATGVGSRVELPGVTTLNASISSSGNDPDHHRVSATDGGVIDLSGLETIHSPQSNYDSLTFDANGIGSEILLGDLVVASGRNTSVLASGGASVSVGKILSPNTNLHVAVSGSDSGFTARGRVWLDGDDEFSVIDGAVFEIRDALRYRNTEEAAVTVRHANVVANGGDTGAGQIVEVGGVDVGLAWPYTIVDDNFAMGTLTVGSPGEATVVRLMDIANNGNRTGSEALYLNPTGSLAGDGLTIEAGSTLVLNGLNVYTWDDANGELVPINDLFGDGNNTMSYSGGWIQLTDMDANDGDVTFDGDVDVDDIDLMIDAVAGGSLHSFFDLDGDTGACDADDMQVLFDQLGTGWGDITLDGVVDDDDLSMLLANWNGLEPTWAIGNFDHLKGVDDDDLSLLLANWGPVPGIPVPVPEPVTLALLAIGSIGLIRRLRFREILQRSPAGRGCGGLGRLSEGAE